jgi:hypothetical protein
MTMPSAGDAGSALPALGRRPGAGWGASIARSGLVDFLLGSVVQPALDALLLRDVSEVGGHVSAEFGEVCLL